MATVTPLSSGRGLPDLTVVEFAVIIALMREGPQPAPLILEILSEWFGQAVGLSDIQPAVRRLIHLGYLKMEEGELRPQREAASDVSTAFSAMIRLVGGQFRRAFELADPLLLDHILKEAARKDKDTDKQKD